jgi:hypothetical protein
VAAQTKAAGAGAGAFLFCAKAQLKVKPPENKKTHNQNRLGERPNKDCVDIKLIL